MTTQSIEKRIERLESSLRVGENPQTLDEMFQAFERGDYGDSSIMSIVVAIASNGGSGEHLRGEGLPDELIDYFVEALKKDSFGDEEVDGK